MEGKLSKMDNTLTETAAQLRGDIESSHIDKFDAISTTIDQLSAGNSKVKKYIDFFLFSFENYF